MRRTSKLLRAAGLGTALRESRLVADCTEQHGRFWDRGYTFCPHCGVKIELIRNCPTCGNRFFSAKAFRYHAIAGHKADKHQGSRGTTVESAYASGYKIGKRGGPIGSAGTYKDRALAEAFEDGNRIGANERRTTATAKPEGK